MSDELSGVDNPKHVDKEEDPSIDRAADAVNAVPAEKRGELLTLLVSGNVEAIPPAQIDKLLDLLTSEKERRHTVEELTEKVDIPQEPEHDQALTVIRSELGVEGDHKETESDVDRAKRLLGHITGASFNSFQEYVLDVSSRDYIGNPSLSKGAGFYATDTIQQAETLFGYPKGPPNTERSPYGTVFCVGGEVDGKFKVKVVGRTHWDQGNRNNASCLDMSFDDQASYEEFTRWLQDNPNAALKNVIDRTMNSYDDRDRPSKKNFPPLLNESRSKTNRYNHPYTDPIRRVHFQRRDKDQPPGEKIVKEYK